MYQHRRPFLACVLGMMLTACASAPPNTPDQLPMYGGLDRSANPILKQADEKLIADVTKEFGSREKASDLFVEQGVRFYLANDYAKAMRRFNQAWLLNPDNPDAYWGFAMVYHDRQRHCEAMHMIDLAVERGLHKPIALADAGRIITLCTSNSKDLSAENKKAAYDRADALYVRANRDAPKNDYILTSWATACLWRGDYAEAWQKVAEVRSLGAPVPGELINLLRAKMPEPMQP